MDRESVKWFFGPYQDYLIRIVVREGAEQRIPLTGVAAGGNGADGAPGSRSMAHFRGVAACRRHPNGQDAGAVRALPAQDMLPGRGSVGRMICEQIKRLLEERIIRRPAREREKFLSAVFSV